MRDDGSSQGGDDNVFQLPKVGDLASTTGRYAIHRSLHGFNDWVEFAKALTSMCVVLGGLFVASLYFILDPRYMQVADGVEIKCSILVAEISQLETQVLLIDSRLRTAADGEANQLQNERAILTLKMIDKRRSATRQGCHLEAPQI